MGEAFHIPHAEDRKPLPGLGACTRTKRLASCFRATVFTYMQVQLQIDNHRDKLLRIHVTRGSPCTSLWLCGQVCFLGISEAASISSQNDGLEIFLRSMSIFLIWYLRLFQSKAPAL